VVVEQLLSEAAGPAGDWAGFSADPRGSRSHRMSRRPPPPALSQVTARTIRQGRN